DSPAASDFWADSRVRRLVHCDSPSGPNRPAPGDSLMRAAMFVLVAGLAFPPAGTRADDPPKGWEFVGRTQAAAADDARARVTGHLTRVAVREGDAVKKGDLLAEIDPRPYRLDLDAAQARLKVAEARLQAAKVKADNAKRLQERNVISP